MMFALATPERPALYLTVLGEPPLKMLRYQQQFEFFDLERVNRCIHFVNLGPDTMTGNLDKVLERIAAEVKSHAPAFVFVDSFRSVALAGDTDSTLQQFMQKLGVLMTSWQATTFLIGEYAADTATNPVFTVSDGLIWLHQKLHGPQDRGHEDAGPAHPCGSAHLPTGQCRRRGLPARQCRGAPTAQRGTFAGLRPCAHGGGRPG
jgi:circadian clock protein KaiC